MDPLQGSALRVLDAGGALSLVLDSVDDDDALCAALACTVFRDGMFAQPRHAVRGAAEGPRAGKRVATGVAAVASSAARLAWVRSLREAAPAWVRKWDASTCFHLAAVGALDALRWARENGCEWSARTCAMAARGGHLEVLRWARENGCPWDSLTCTLSAGAGHLEVLRWARENGAARGMR